MMCAKWTAPTGEISRGPEDRPGTTPWRSAADEVSLSDKRIETGGSLRRLTVAVVVDGVPSPTDPKLVVPRPHDELDRLQALVSSAVGADPKRGDVVTVESVPFIDLDKAVAAEPALPAEPVHTRKQLMIAGGVAAGVVLLAVVLLLRRRRAKPVLLATVGDEPKLEPRPIEAQIIADPRGEALSLAARDPATSALVVRAWLGAGEQAKA